MRGPGGKGVVDRHAILERRFSENLKRIIKQRGLKYEELGRLTGISASALHNYATKKRRINLTRAFIIAVVLGVTWDDLLGANWERDTLKEFKELGIISEENELQREEGASMIREQVKWPGATGLCVQCFEPVSESELYRHRPGGRTFHKRCFDTGGYYVQVEKKEKERSGNSE